MSIFQLDFPFLLLSISQNWNSAFTIAFFGLDFPFPLLSISQNWNSAFVTAFFMYAFMHIGALRHFLYGLNGLLYRTTPQCAHCTCVMLMLACMSLTSWLKMIICKINSIIKCNPMYDECDLTAFVLADTAEQQNCPQWNTTAECCAILANGGRPWRKSIN